MIPPKQRTAVSGEHRLVHVPLGSGRLQLRLYVPRETVARLVDLQARALAAGFRKPTYSDLIQAAVSKVDTSDLADLLENVGS